jgi:hypothetical protein
MLLRTAHRKAVHAGQAPVHVRAPSTGTKETLAHLLVCPALATVRATNNIPGLGLTTITPHTADWKSYVAKNMRNICKFFIELQVAARHG